MISNRRRFAIPGLTALISLTIFFYPSTTQVNGDALQSIAVLFFFITSYILSIQYFFIALSPATAADLIQLFDSGSGQIILAENTDQRRPQYFSLVLNRRDIKIHSPTSSIPLSFSGIRQGVLVGAIISILLVPLLIWFHSLYLHTDFIMLYFTYGVMILCSIFLLVFFFKQKRSETPPLEFHKQSSNIDITCMVNLQELSGITSNSSFEPITVSIPANNLAEELSILPKEEHMEYHTGPYIHRNYASLAIRTNLDFDTIVDSDVSEDISKHLLSQSLSLFSLPDSDILETFRQNLLQWAI